MQNRVAIYCFDQDSQVISDSMNYGVDTVSRLNGEQGTNVNNGQFQYLRYFTKGGLYRVRLSYISDTVYGIWTIKWDSTSMWTNLDMYNATTIQGKNQDILVEIPRGYHIINFTNNGKNASSSNYLIRMHFLFFDLVQEYPVYQDDKPAQINQGSMVLLAKHKAVVAEGTFTLNLADVINTKYSEIVVKINGGATASLALQATINALGANYLQKGLSSIGGAVTAINITTGSILKLASTSILTGATKFESWFTIKRQDDGTWTMGQWGSTGFSVGNESGSWNNDQTSTTTLTQIVISTSTSTWKAGTEIEVYGVKTT